MEPPPLPRACLGLHEYTRNGREVEIADRGRFPVVPRWQDLAVAQHRKGNRADHAVCGCHMRGAACDEGDPHAAGTLLDTADLRAIADVLPEGPRHRTREEVVAAAYLPHRRHVANRIVREVE